MTKFKYQIELAFKSEELLEGNSFLNKGNLKENQLIQDQMITLLEEIIGAGIQFMRLKMDWIIEYDADLSITNTDLLTADAEPLIINAKLLTTNAKCRLPIVIAN